MGQASVTIEVAGSAEQSPRNPPLPLPAGKFLRLLLIRVCTIAVQSGSANVRIGDTATELADQIGVDLKGARLRELAQQWERLAAARVSVSNDGGPALVVFDARGRSRATAEWRSTVRLTARFFTSLTQNPVPLDRSVVGALAESPLALDIYAWLAQATRDESFGSTFAVTWEDLRLRFGIANQSPAEFRTNAAKSLDALAAADTSLAINQDDAGATFVRRSRAALSAPPEPATQPLAAGAAPTAIEQPNDNDASPVPATSTDAPQIEAPEIAEASVVAAPSAEPTKPFNVSQPVEPVSAPPEAVEPRQQQTAPVPEIIREKVGLKQHLTGLQQTIWLQRRNGRDNLVIEVTPGGRYDPDALTVLALEPMVLQVRGGLPRGDFERVAAWANSNRDLIEDFWDYDIDSDAEIATRVKKVPLPGWR